MGSMFTDKDEKYRCIGLQSGAAASVLDIVLDNGFVRMFLGSHGITGQIGVRYNSVL